MIKAVVDTNVIASGFVGLHAPRSLPGEILRRWLADEFELVVSDHILDEIDRTLQKTYFRDRLPPGLVFETVRKFATVIEGPGGVTGVTAHPKDDLVLAAALNARAPFLVTGDAAFRAVGQFGIVRIVTPREFIDVLDAQDAPDD